MSLPAVPLPRIRWTYKLSPAPFPFVLLHKFKRWADRRDAPEVHKRRRHSKDATDVLCLLDLPNEMRILQALPSWWKDVEPLDAELQAYSVVRVKQFCAQYSHGWCHLLFEGLQSLALSPAWPFVKIKGNSNFMQVTLRVTVTLQSASDS
ncbi:hypothetical protein C8R43DRAFT_317375 [Mycena crocata]|nr:hypothetical protein C8R43DRAFT_317375 [Mycena crocata]